MYHIYKIVNKVNQKCYVGLTNSPKRRGTRHFSDLRCGVHDNSHLQRSFDKYGEDMFYFEVIHSEDCTSDEISNKEIEYVDKYNSFEEGYNMNRGGFINNGFMSKFSREDVFNILASSQNVPRSGGMLAEIFDTSATSIKRIKEGSTCTNDVYAFNQLSMQEQQGIFSRFDAEFGITENTNSRISRGIRKFTDERYLEILAYSERHKRKSPTIAKMLDCDPSTIRLFIRGKTNLDIHTIYTTLTQLEKDYIYAQAKNFFESNESLHGDM